LEGVLTATSKPHGAFKPLRGLARGTTRQNGSLLSYVVSPLCDWSDVFDMLHRGIVPAPAEGRIPVARITFSYPSLTACVIVEVKKVPGRLLGLSRSLLKLAERDGRASYPQFTARRGMPT